MTAGKEALSRRERDEEDGDIPIYIVLYIYLERFRCFEITTLFSRAVYSEKKFDKSLILFIFFFHHPPKYRTCPLEQLISSLKYICIYIGHRATLIKTKGLGRRARGGEIRAAIVCA